MTKLDLLEFETLAALNIAQGLVNEQRVIVEREADKLSWLLDAVEEGQRRIAAIRDVRENL